MKQENGERQEKGSFICICTVMTIVTNRKKLQNGRLCQDLQQQSDVLSLYQDLPHCCHTQRMAYSSITSSCSPSLLPVLLYQLPAWEYTVGVLQILQSMYCPMLCCTWFWRVGQCLITIITHLNTKQDQSNEVLMKLALPTSQINQGYHWLWALASNRFTLVMESSCLTWTSPCRK